MFRKNFLNYWFVFLPLFSPKEVWSYKKCFNGNTSIVRQGVIYLSERVSAVSVCANLCEAHNIQPGYSQALSLLSNFTSLYPGVTMTSLTPSLISVQHDIFFLESANPPSVINPLFYAYYNKCIGFNYNKEMNLCQFFSFYENSTFVSASGPHVSYYQKAPFGPCLIKYRDCEDVEEIYNDEHVYWMMINGVIQPVLCIYKNGYKYTVMQRRVGPDVDFRRKWLDYKKGFGKMNGSLWIGNEAVHQLTNAFDYKLRVEIMYFNNISFYQEYNQFIMTNENQEYSVDFSTMTGNAGNSIYRKRGFSAIDRDNDNHWSHCSSYYGAGWWFLSCHSGMLNGKYQYPGSHQSSICMSWAKYGVNSPLMRSMMLLYR